MSRIGKNPIAVPDKVDVKINGAQVSVKGPNGELKYTFTDKVLIELKDKMVTVSPKSMDNQSKALWGTTRTVISNLIVGVTTGFTTQLEFNGVGYKAAVKGNILELSLGYSHPINYELPKGITAKVNKNQIDILGCNKELVGQVAAKVRSFRPPEPYKGKGIKYLDEHINRKAGKTGSK